MENENREIAIKVSNVRKKYRLGQIGGGSLQADLQSWWARIRGKEDPNTKIGTDQRSFGKTFMALNGLDLTVYKGEALGIIGRNGAGKSTLLKLLSRVTAPTDGEIDIYGRIASMLEVGTGFNGEMTGRENVYMNGAILGMSKEEIDSKMEQIIEFSEVREFIDTPVKRYSSGMFVKLAFSVAAHLDSEIMIMDEVLAVGDMAFQKKCLDKMKEAANQDGRTVLYVSHNMNTIRQLCDRCVVLDEGKVIFDGDVEKAVSIYLGTFGKLSNTYEYTKEHHTHKNSNDDFVIKSLRLLSHNTPQFDVGEKFSALIKCYSKKEIKGVCFRFEFTFQDGTKVGSMMSANSFDIKKGINDINLKINTSHLTYGQYNVDIIAYVYNEYGTGQTIDAVYPGMVLNINDRLNSENKVNWIHRYWGYVKLSDIIIEND